MRGCLDEETILGFVEGRLQPDAVAEVERHANQCPTCLELIAGASDGADLDPDRTHPAPPVYLQTTRPREADTRVPGASAPPIASLPELGQRRFPGYRIHDVIGRGGMGVVYRALHEASGREVALKTVRAGTPGALASIRREFYALSCVHHPGVVRILEQGVQDGQPWYAMALIQGRTLREYLLDRSIQKDPRPQDAALLGILCRLARTLAFLHGRGIVHRDLTPQNVVIQPDGTPVLVDFGLATRDDRAGRDLIESAANVGGTILFMAPEQIRGELVDARADLYALGCILYEAVTGRPPFSAPSWKGLAYMHVHDTPALPSACAAGIDPALDTLIMSLLAKRARHRIGYAEDVAAALLPFSDPGTRASSGERAAVYVYRPEFSGRGELFRTFEQMLWDTGEGRGALAFIAGESGMGKTRFVAELAVRARALGLQVVVGECMAISARPTRDTERSTALHALRPLLREVIELCGASRERAASLVGARGKLLAAYEPGLLDLPGQDEEPDPPALSTEAARYRLLRALQETIAALAAEGPLLLVLDDLQWADDLSLDLLETFPRDFFERHRVLLVGTYRSEEVTPRLEKLLRARDARGVTLGRFDAAAIERMVSDMLALQQVPPQLIEPLLAASEGNPFFAAEYLRVAVDESVIVREVGGTWTLDADRSAALRLPTSHRGLIEHRLARLSAPARQMLEVASVLGRQSDSDLLFATAGLTEREGMDASKELVARAFLEVSGEMLRFVHDKLREVAYESIAQDRCRSLHHRAAEAMEAREGSIDPSYAYPLLSHHWARAGAPRKAINYLEAAGEQALTMAAYAEAAGFFQRALELTQGLVEGGGPPVDPLRVARWQRRLGEAYYALGDLSRCAVHSSRALAGFGHPLPASRAGWVAELVTQVGRQARSVGMPARRAERAPDRRAPMVEAALAAARIAHHYYFSHDGLALAAVSFLSVNLAERASTSVRMARPYAQLGYFAGVCRLRAIADAYFARAQQNAQATQDPNELAIALYHEATYHVGEGAWDRALTIGGRALELLEEIKDPQESEIVQTILGHAEYGAGRYADSIARCEALFASAHARANIQHEAWGLYASARGMIRLGRFDEALDRIGQARTLLLKQPELPSEILCVGLAARAHLGRGDLQAAGSAAEHGIELMNRTMAVFSLGDGYAGVAEVYLALAEREAREAGRVSAALMARVERARAVLRRFAMLFPLGQPASLLADGRAHLLAGHPRRAERCLQRARARAVALSMPYEQAMADLLLGRHGQNARAREHHLRAARSAFARLGCEAELKAT